MSISDVMFNALVSVGVTGSITLGALNVLPTDAAQTSDFFDVRAIEVTRDGDTASLRVDRTIAGPITMSFTVRIMERNGDGWSQFCRMSGPPIEYRPDAILPDPLSLSWWTYGECPVLPEGDAQIWTTWTPYHFGLTPISIVADVPGR